MKPILLMYHFSGEREAKVRMAAMRWQILCRTVPQASLELSLKDVLAKVQPVSAPKEDLPEEMLVMAGFSGVLLTQFLQSLKKSGVSVPLKAVLTDANAEWSSLTLYHELCGERDAINNGQSPVHEARK